MIWVNQKKTYFSHYASHSHCKFEAAYPVPLAVLKLKKCSNFGLKDNEIMPLWVTFQLCTIILHVVVVSNQFWETRVNLHAIFFQHFDSIVIWSFTNRYGTTYDMPWRTVFHETRRTHPSLCWRNMKATHHFEPLSLTDPKEDEGMLRP